MFPSIERKSITVVSSARNAATVLFLGDQSMQQILEVGIFQYGEETENLAMGPERLGIRRWCNQDVVP